MKPNEAAFEEYVRTLLVEHGGYAEVKRPGQGRPSVFDSFLPVASNESGSRMKARP